MFKKVWKGIKGVISSLALILAGNILSLLFAVLIVVFGGAAAIAVLVCGIALCVIFATIPSTRFAASIKSIIEELS